MRNFCNEVLKDFILALTIAAGFIVAFWHLIATIFSIPYALLVPVTKKSSQGTLWFLREIVCAELHFMEEIFCNILEGETDVKND